MSEPYSSGYFNNYNLSLTNPWESGTSSGDQSSGAIAMAQWGDPPPGDAATGAPETRTSRHRTRIMEQMINPQHEVITEASILMNPTHQDTSPPWATVPRVLISDRYNVSYTWEDTVVAFGYANFVRAKTWKTITPLGKMVPIGIANVYVLKSVVGVEANPFLVDFHVLPGSPPVGGVFFILGAEVIAEEFGSGWRPDWTAQHYALRRSEQPVIR